MKRRADDALWFSIMLISMVWLPIFLLWEVTR